MTGCEDGTAWLGTGRKDGEVLIGTGSEDGTIGMYEYVQLECTSMCTFLMLLRQILVCFNAPLHRGFMIMGFEILVIILHFLVN